MAELKRQVLGDATGKVGHVVFRIKGNKNLICNDPHRTAVPSADTLARRARFKLAAQVAKGIYESGLLKNIWPKPGTNKGTRFSEMFKKNYAVIGSPDNFGRAEVTPDHGVKIPNAAIVLTQQGMTITADQFEASAQIDPNIEKFLSAEGIVVMTTPVKDTDLPYRVLSIKTGNQSLDNDQPVNLSFVFGGIDLSTYEAYTTKKVYLTFLTQTAAGEIVHYTEQFNN
jgi:hypothetical protein